MKAKSSIAWRTDFLAFATNSGEDEEEETTGYKYRETEFFDDEKITKQVDYDKNGGITLELYNKFDNKGRLIESLEINHEDELEEKTILEYDSEGRLISETQYYNDEIFEKAINIYNADGLLTETATFDADEAPFLRQTREYNDKKQNILIRHYEEGEPIWEIKRIFDEGELPVEEITTLLKEKKSERTKHTYNGEGKRIKSEVFDRKGNHIHTTEDEYDENGNHIRQINDGAIDNTSTIRTNVYDENNRLTETEIYDALNNILSSKEIYIYNEKGQPIEQEFYHNNTIRGMQKTHFLLKIEYCD